MLVTLFTTLLATAQEPPVETTPEVPPAPAPTIAVAPAVPLPAPQPYRRDWARVDQRANLVSTVSFWSGVGCQGVWGATFYDLDAIDLYVASSLGMYVATPIAASTSLRSRTALNRQGARVGSGGGVTAWALWGSALALNLAASNAYDSGTLTLDEYDAVTLTSGALNAGALFSVVMQQNANRRARSQLVPVQAAPPSL